MIENVENYILNVLKSYVVKMRKCIIIIYIEVIIREKEINIVKRIR